MRGADNLPGYYVGRPPRNGQCTYYVHPSLPRRKSSQFRKSPRRSFLACFRLRCSLFLGESATRSAIRIGLAECCAGSSWMGTHRRANVRRRRRRPDGREHPAPGAARLFARARTCTKRPHWIRRSSANSHDTLGQKRVRWRCSLPSPNQQFRP